MNEAALPDRDPTLRQRAEGLVQTKNSDASPAASASNGLPETQLLHEVQVHQIELEMQNEELLRTHMELDAAKARYFDLYDLAPVGYCTLSAEGVVLEANLAAATLLGTPRSVLKQKALHRFFAQSSQDLYYLCLHAFAETGAAGTPGATDAPCAAQDCELQLSPLQVSAHAPAHWIQMRMSAVQASGGDGNGDGARTLRVVFHDITERKRLEAETRTQRAELERALQVADKANRAKSEFLSSMTHELRSPLNAILGFAQLLNIGPTPPTPKQKANIDQIVQAGWYLLDLVNEVLDLSLVESGKVVVTLVPVPLAAVLQDCQAMMEPLAQKREIHVHYAMPPASWALMADATRLKQVCVNLLTNAIQYNRDKGRISISCTQRPGGRVRVTVADTGAGLSADQLGQIFQPFNRLGRQPSDRAGTGIGLAISKHMVELMGGSMGADSTVGVGSEFWFELATPASAGSRP